jgi:hypothetical protein
MVTSPWLAVPLFVVLGGATTLVTVAVVSERQAVVPDQLLGRVVSAFRLVGNGVAPLGSIVGGVIAASAGLRAPSSLPLPSWLSPWLLSGCIGYGRHCPDELARTCQTAGRCPIQTRARARVWARRADSTTPSDVKFAM